MNPKALAALRNILSKLYSDERSIRRILDDSGVNSSKMTIDIHAENSWHSVLSEAEKHHQVDALLQRVENEYGNNHEFQAAYQTYRQSQSKQENVNLHATISTHQPKTHPKTWQQRLPSVLMGIALMGLVGGGAYWMLGGSQSGGNVTPTATATVSSSGVSEEKSAEGSSTSAELPTSTLAVVLPSPTNIAIVTNTATAATPITSIPQSATSLPQATAIIQATNTPPEADSALCAFAFLVLDEQSEEPIRKATIAVFVGVRQDTGTTDSTGYYLAHLPCNNEQAVEARVRVSADDYIPYNRSVFLSNETTEILLKSKATPTPNIMLTAIITPTLGIAKTYPCEAKISPSVGTDVVRRVRAIPSINGALMPAIQAETIVEVQEAKFVESEAWYHIFDKNGREFGWIQSSYLQLFSACPG